MASASSTPASYAQRSYVTQPTAAAAAGLCGQATGAAGFQGPAAEGVDQPLGEVHECRLWKAAAAGVLCTASISSSSSI
jgi:hypothetical protein